MSRTLGSFLATGILCCITLAAQVPNLSVLADNGSHGIVNITVVNNYNTPATSYIIASRYTKPRGTPCPAVKKDRFGRCLGVEFIQFSDVPSKRDTNDGILAEAAVKTFALPNADKVLQAECLAVIYSDGKTAGDPLWVARVFDRRRQMLDDTGAALTLLRRAANNPDANRNLLITIFTKMEAAHEKLLNPPLDPSQTNDYGPGGFFDDVCSVALYNLKHSDDPDVKPTVQGLIIIFDRWQSELQSALTRGK